MLNSSRYTISTYNVCIGGDSELSSLLWSKGIRWEQRKVEKMITSSKVEQMS